MEGFMTTKEAAEKWNISVRQVQNHCKSGRIKGVLRVGTNYLIPKDAMKPTYVYVYECNETLGDVVTKVCERDQDTA